MKRRAFFVLMCLVAFGYSTVQAQGFVKFLGVDGEVTVEGYEGWSEFSSVTQEVVVPETNEGLSRRGLVPEFHQLAIIKPLDKASIKIAERALRGAKTELVQIEWARSFDSGLEPYYTYELTNAQVLEYKSKGIGHSQDEVNTDGRIYEEIVLDFEEIKVTYREYDSEGNFLGAWEYSWQAR